MTFHNILGYDIKVTDEAKSFYNSKQPLFLDSEAVKIYTGIAEDSLERRGMIINSDTLSRKVNELIIKDSKRYEKTSSVSMKDIGKSVGQNV